MIDFRSVGAEICVIGPADFAQAPAAYALAELLARNFPTAYCPPDPAADTITLPNGRTLPTFPPGRRARVTVQCGRGGDSPPADYRLAWADPDLEADLLILPPNSPATLRPSTILPLAFDLDPLLARPAAPLAIPLRIGALEADPRLAPAFRRAFAADPTVRLVPDPASLEDLDLLVGATQLEPALALGKLAIALTDLRAPGLFPLEADAPIGALADALAEAHRFAATRDAARTVGDRRACAAARSFSALASSVGTLIDPSIADFRPTLFPPSPAARALATAKLGPRAAAISGTRRQVCPAYDGGFFSVFNAFLSHLTWQQPEHRCHAVFPDWDIDRTLASLPHRASSFCYGQPGDGNLWTRLFLPLYGATDADMNDQAFLWQHAEAPADRHNEDREPTLTYVRAFTLYNNAEFAAIRRQYHRTLTSHVRLRPDLAAEIDAFAAQNLTTPILIAAHVRHPSHTVEQPGHRIAAAAAYIARIRAELARRGADPDGDGWTVFVATDQDRVLHQFRAAFGPRAVFYPDARRTRADEDAAFDALSPAEQNQDGHQLQHLVAADPAGWTWRMAREVVRDAWTMARCHALLHVVSNVSTAVAAINPDLEMIFCEP